MIRFNFYHIKLLRGKTENQLVISGEIENLSGKDCNTVAIRVILFGLNKSLINTVIMLRGLNYGQTKAFYKEVDIEHCNELLEKITRHEISVESVY